MFHTFVTVTVPRPKIFTRNVSLYIETNLSLIWQNLSRKLSLETTPISHLGLLTFLFLASIVTNTSALYPYIELIESTEIVCYVWWKTLCGSCRKSDKKSNRKKKVGATNDIDGHWPGRRSYWHSHPIERKQDHHVTSIFSNATNIITFLRRKKNKRKKSSNFVTFLILTLKFSLAPIF